jgi:nucleotide-binding universal stress UspA family protein
MADYDKVLVAIDGTESSSRVLEHVRVLAAIHDSEVIVFHVRQLAYSGASTLHVGPSVEISAEEAAANLVKAGIGARAVEEDAYWGHTADSIVQAADREQAKVIVIGTRGRGKTAAVLLGSVAYKVLHLAKQPVLAIP